MTPEKKLDIVLDYFRGNKAHNDAAWQIVSNKVGVDLNELVLKLIKEEYIIKRESMPYTTVTIDGQLFKGYVRQKRRANLKQFALFMESLLLVIFSAIGASWVIIEIISKYCNQ